MSPIVGAARLLGGTSASPLSQLRHRLPVRSSGPRRPVLTASALSLFLAAGGTGCAAQAGVSLPPRSRNLPVPVALDSPAPTARQQVIDAYNGYWQAFAAAMSSQNAARARAILAPYDSPSTITQAVQADQRVWAAHETAYGGAVTHIMDVALTGGRALVHDCLDLSHFGAENVRTRRIVPESFGLPHLNFYVTVRRSGSRWLVTNMQPVEVPCAP
jgi:hypothetical protein